MEEEPQKKRDYLLPASILIAAVLVSGSIFYLVGNLRGDGNQAFTFEAFTGESTGESEGSGNPDIETLRN